MILSWILGFFVLVRILGLNKLVFVVIASMSEHRRTCDCAGVHHSESSSKPHSEVLLFDFLLSIAYTMFGVGYCHFWTFCWYLMLDVTHVHSAVLSKQSWSLGLSSPNYRSICRTSFALLFAAARREYSDGNKLQLFLYIREQRSERLRWKQPRWKRSMILAKKWSSRWLKKKCRQGMLSLLCYHPYGYIL